MKTLEWPSQSPDLNSIEMLWHDLKKEVHARKPSNVAELQQFCQDEWAKIPPQHCNRLIASYRKCLITVVAAIRVAQPIIRFRGQALFHTGPCGFGFCFPFIIKNFIQKLHVVYLCYL